MNLDLHSIVLNICKDRITQNVNFNMIKNTYGERLPIFKGEYLQKIDGIDVSRVVRFCTPAYIVDCSEFSWAKGSKKALKLTLDSSGYMSEKVIWPDYETGVLSYNKEIKKGAVCLFFYYKKPGKPYTNIIDVEILSKSILTK